MKKGILFGIIIGIIATTVVGVFADDILEATSIKYKKKTVQDALNELYIKANAKDVGALKFCKFVDGTYGSFGEIGSKYECDPGDGVTRNFYLLANNNDNSVELIMDRNITDNINWDNSMKYFRTGAGASTKTAWANVINVDLPKAQDIANAVDNTNFIASSASATCWCLGDGKTNGACGVNTCSATVDQQNRAWLYNHLNNCVSYGCSDQSDALSDGYWTRDLLSGYHYVWVINNTGDYNNRSKATNFGLRPVITVLKTNLYSE